MPAIFSLMMFVVVTKHVIVHFVKVPLGIHLALLRFSVLMFYVIKHALKKIHGELKM